MSRQIKWEELDKPRYYFTGLSVFFCIRCLVYPNHLVKTRLQVQIGKDVYKGTLDAFRKILKVEGIRGFYKGFPLFALGIFFGQVYITAFEFTKSKCSNMNPLLQGMCAGAAGSIAGQSLSVPADVVSQRLMVQGMSSKPTATTSAKGSMQKIAQKIWVKEGVSGFYRGYAISLMSNMPSSAIWWGSYNMLIEKSTDYFEANELGRNKLPVQATCGVMSGLLSAVLTNTLDVIRTRIQVGGSRSSKKVLLKLWREEGLGIFVKGLTARMLHMSSNSLLVIIGYETVKKWSVKDEFKDTAAY